MSDIFIFQISINEQSIKRGRQKTEKRNSFVTKNQKILTLWKNWTSGESSVANESRHRPEYSKRNLPLYRHDDRLHHHDDRLRGRDDRLHDVCLRQLTTTTTVFVAKNCAPHDRKSFFPYEEPEFAAFYKGCVLSLTKQYYTITPFLYCHKKWNSSSGSFSQKKRVCRNKILLTNRHKSGTDCTASPVTIFNRYKPLPTPDVSIVPPETGKDFFLPMYRFPSGTNRIAPDYFDF